MKIPNVHLLFGRNQTYNLKELRTDVRVFMQSLRTCFITAIRQFLNLWKDLSVQTHNYLKIRGSRHSVPSVRKERERLEKMREIRSQYEQGDIYESRKCMPKSRANVSVAQM